MPLSKEISPVPSMVRIDEGPRKNAVKKALEFGVATPGTMATATSSTIDLASPLGIFSAFAASSRALFDDHDESEKKVAVEVDDDDDDEDDDDIDDEDDDDNSGDDVKASKSQKRLGISRPAYQDSDDDDAASANSDRIGIQSTTYELPAGDIPVLSPIDMLLKKKKKKKSRKYDSDDDGEDLWQLKLEQSESALPTSMMISDDSHVLPNDDVGRMLHKQTSEGHYLMNSQPLDAPMTGMKYSLEEGKGGMKPLQRQVSDSRLFRQKTRPNILRASSSPGLEGGAFKVFLLLIAPKSKIFEIIQVFYSPLVTTVANLLDMIPNNATEPALGAQQYIGMCRPSDGGREIDTSFMASASSGGTGCAKIIRGEIMVAIPKGYNGPICAKFAKPLLTNPRVTKLLNKSDPLAPGKKKKKKRRASSKSQRYRSIAIEHERRAAAPTHSGNPYATPAGSTNPYDTGDKERKLLRKALQRGEMEAAESNGDDAYFTGNNSEEEGEALRMPLELWQTQMHFRDDDSSCASSVGSLGDLADSSTPRTSQRRGSDLGLGIPEEVEPTPALVDDNLTPSTKGSSNNNDFDALQATLQTKDVSGAIEAFGKLLSSMGGAGQDEDVMKQLYAAVQKGNATKSN